MQTKRITSIQKLKKTYNGRENYFVGKALKIVDNSDSWFLYILKNWMKCMKPRRENQYLSLNHLDMIQFYYLQ